MKIHGSTDPLRPSRSAMNKDGRTAEKGNVSAVETVKLSGLPQRFAKVVKEAQVPNAVFDQSRVNAIKDAIRKGDFKVDSKVVAEHLLQGRRIRRQERLSMASEQELYAALAEALEHEARHLAQLIDLLKEERKDLVESTSERISQIAAEKMHRIQALDNYAARRSLLLDLLGCQANAEGMQAAIGCAGEKTKHLRKLWETVGERATAARDINDLNGALIRARLNSVQGRLSELHRAAQHGDGLYGADGLARAAAMSRPLGEV